MRLLIAGCGYLGMEIARQTLQRGWDVTGVSRGSASSAKLIEQGMAAVIGDISCVDDCREFPKVDAIVHCASSNRGGEEEYRKVYLDGCRALIAAQPDARFLFVSSTSVYAQTEGEWVDESSPTLPPRSTGLVLLEAERCALDHGGVVARLAGIYGPERSVLLKMFLSGESVIDVREGSPDGRWLNQIHRDDAASAVCHLLLDDFDRAKGNIWNVCDGSPLTQKQLYAGMAERFSLPMPPTAAPDLQRKRGWTNKRLSNARLCHQGWAPSFQNYLTALDRDERIIPSIRAQLA